VLLLPEVAGAERAATPLVDHPGSWAVVSSGDCAALARAVTFAGTKTLDLLPTELREQLRVHRRQGDVRLVGGPEEPQTDPQTRNTSYVCDSFTSTLTPPAPPARLWAVAGP
jgi:hypothetical protein